MTVAAFKTAPDTNFAHNLLEIRQSHEKDIAVALKDYDPADKESFSEVINCVERLGVSRKQIAEHLNATQATVSRWASGKTVPPLYSRDVIARRLSELIAR